MATRKPARPAARKPARSARASRTPSRGARAARTPSRKPRASTARKTRSAALKPRRTPETLRLRAFMPSFTVDDLQRSIDFYTGTLGFIEGERWAEEGKLLGIMLKAGACELGLSQDDWAKGRDRKKGVGFRLWCATGQDIDALAARIKAAGGRLVQEPTDEYGSRNLTIDDPDGYRLTFSRKS
jgi:catechol 2,3-dioxygenase-like lactoylglutathione lyase family enzyme